MSPTQCPWVWGFGKLHSVFYCLMGPCVLSEAPASAVLLNTPVGKSSPSSAFSRQIWMGEVKGIRRELTWTLIPKSLYAECSGVCWCQRQTREKMMCVVLFSLPEREAGWNEVMGFMRLLARLPSNKETQVFKVLKRILTETPCVSQKTDKQRIKAPNPMTLLPFAPRLMMWGRSTGEKTRGTQSRARESQKVILGARGTHAGLGY